MNEDEWELLGDARILTLRPSVKDVGRNVLVTPDAVQQLRHGWIDV